LWYSFSVFFNIRYDNQNFLSRARAAFVCSVLNRVSDGVEGFQEGRSVATRRGIASVVGLNHSQLHTRGTARAALLLLTSGLLALQLALGSLAVGGFHTLVVAFQFFADRRAFGFGSSASGVALSRSTDGFTLGAVFLFTIILGATNGADRAFAMNDALGASCLFTSHFTFGTSAHRVADSRALRIIALPFALRVALLSQNSSSRES